MRKAGGLSLLTAPFRFIWGMLLSGIFLLVSPLLLLGLPFGSAFMNPDEIGLTKILLVALGPFAFVFWWIIIGRYRAKSLMSARSKTGYDFSDEEITLLATAGKPRHVRNFVFLLVSLCGSVCSAMLFHNAGDMQFFLMVLAGIFSPAIIVAVYKVLFCS